MGWSLGGTRIIITDESIQAKNIIARLQPLSGGTIKQKFGYESQIFKLQGFVVGETDKNAVLAMSTTSTLYPLLDYDDNLVVSGYVSSVNVIRIPSSFQDLRPDLDCNSPVFRVDIELYG